MVNVQNLMPLSTYTKWQRANQSSPAVLKCPVCGYSELDQNFRASGYNDSVNFTGAINTDNSEHSRQLTQ
jgi:uncharacterized protein (DUF2225 family)